MQTASVPAAAATLATVGAMPSSTDIARRSHELYLARGGADGHDVEDWLQAEAELRFRH